MTWTRYLFKEHRTHVVPKRLALALLHDLTTRHGAELENVPVRETSGAPEFQNTSIVSSWAIDLGGMWTAGSPTVTVHLRGLSIEVLCHHVSLVIARLRRLKPQRFADDGDLWYGLPHWHHALILLPQQYLSLLAQLVAIAPLAELQSEYFEKARAKLNAITVPIMTSEGEIVRGIGPP